MEEENKNDKTKEKLLSCDVDDFNSNLSKITQDLNSKLQLLNEQQSEFVILKDERQGLSVELSSRKLPIVQLIELGVQTFDWLQKQKPHVRRSYV